jgi:multidrug transporter EmrE-like cation transporter
MRQWVFFAVLCLFELGADVFAKKHVISGKILWAILAVSGYVLGNAAWVVSLRSGMLLSVGAILFGIITGISAMAVGIGLYDESATKAQMAGMLLGIVAIGLLVAGGP